MLRLAGASAILITLTLLLALFAPQVSLPSAPSWFWLTASGIIGLAFGDAFLYRAFVSLGPERTSQIQTLAPATTAALAWLFLREYLLPLQLAGMALVLAGVFLATSGAAKGKHAGNPGAGIRAAVLSALLQGLGTIMARRAFLGQADLDPIQATTIRICSGAFFLWAHARVRGPLRPTLGAWRDPRILRLLLGGILLGPVAGMLCYISALKYAPAGIVTTITFMAPLLIIPIGARIYGTRIAAVTLWGAALSVAGVALLGLAH